MLTPVLGLVAGLLAVLYACLSYGGSSLLGAAPSFLRRKGNLLWLVGWVAIGLALMMGMAGFLLKADLGLFRILLGVTGLALLCTRTYLATRRAHVTLCPIHLGDDVVHIRWVQVAVVGGVVLVLSTEALSLFKGLTTQAVALLWLAAALLGGVYLWRRRGSLAMPGPPAGTINRALTASVVFLVVLLGLVAFFVPPNTWDAMAYHVARIAHWAQQGSVAHYHTTITRQIYQPPGASFAILHLYLLAQGDRFVNLVQWASMVGSLLGVWVLAALLGGGQRARVLAMVVAATIPIGVLEATTAQNDYVEAFWLVCLAVFVVARQGPVFVGLALGLALLTKGTGYPFAAPLVAWWAAEAIARKRWRAVGPLAIVALLAVGINAGHYTRNLAGYGTPLGPGRDGPFVYANERHGVLPTLSVAVRNLALHAATPWPRVNTGVTTVIERLHGWAGLDMNDPLTTWYQKRFAVGPFHVNEDLVPNGAHLVLIGLSFVAALVRRRPRRLAIYVVTLVISFLVFSAAFRWQPWHTRLELPLFVLAAPVVGLVLEHRRLVGPLVGVGLLALALLTILFNESRPPTGERSVFRAERTAQLFANRRDLEAAYRAAASRIKDLRCQRVAIWSARDAAEYPLWVLTGAHWNGVRVEHFNMEHPAATSCALFISPLYDAPASIPVAGVPYRRNVWASPVALYVQEPY